MLSLRGAWAETSMEFKECVFSNRLLMDGGEEADSAGVFGFGSAMISLEWCFDTMYRLGCWRKGLKMVSFS